jgi:hypothetical protein
VKKIRYKDGRLIETPWLRVDESAIYCGMSRSSFVRRAAQVPHGGSSSFRMYHTEVLDNWMAGRLDVPFIQDDDTLPSGARQTNRRKGGKKTFSLTVPATGRVFTAEKAER